MKKLSIFSLARENMRRRVFQTLAVVLMVGVATATLFTATMLLLGMKAGVRRGMVIMGADLLVTPEANELDTRTLLAGEAQRMVLGPAAPPALVDRDLVSTIAKVKGVEAVTPQTYLSTWNEGACCRLVNTQLIGFDRQTDFTVKSLLEQKIIWPIGEKEIVVGNAISPPLDPGETVFPWRIYGADFTIVGRLKKTGTGVDYALFIPLIGVHYIVENAAELAGPEQAAALNKFKLNSVSSFLVRADTFATDPKELAKKLRKALPPGMSVFSMGGTFKNLHRQFFGILQGLFAFGMTVWGMSILVVGAMFSMTINERKRETGLLRAMGASARSIFGLVIYESSMLTGLGGIIGVGLGAGFVYYFDSVIKTSLKIPYAWPPANYILALVLICVAAAAVAGVVGALYPAIRSSKMEPLNAIRQGE